MDADLGLFYQLLEMVEGDWSDSIEGICKHIRERFSAQAVFLSVFDRNYNEFIYITFSISNDLRNFISEKGFVLSRESALDIIKKVYLKKKNILEYGIFEGSALLELTSIYLDDNKKEAKNIIRETGMKTVVAIPDLDASGDYVCYFHILTNRLVENNEKTLINDYLTQLHVALEIVFLVRDLYIKATHDGLTKLFNHKQGHILLGKEIDRVQRNKQPLSIAMVDIDFFKKINDRHGHQAGNKVLEYLAELFSATLRKCDVISRYGGEEFLIVLPDTGKLGACEVIKRLKDSIENHAFIFNGRKCSVTASFGLCQYDRVKHHDALALIKDADEYLYRAKQNGRNRIEC
ncbi:MAG TPA: GGDEF domain-containing protein [Spirochaetota bacterium]|nr:GGDEF domain-containing protein [Spirochaetota bacterium]HPI87859.1 GGDEF domain-containing protein [Spirochaetota bacterium]HPR47409.1 GGDEF domain-containing protein [Spirochaetota bacterium]